MTEGSGWVPHAGIEVTTVGVREHNPEWLAEVEVDPVSNDGTFIE
jgi:hypothetical protein